MPILTSINITTPIIYKLDFQNYMISINIITDTISNTIIDLSKKLLNETKIISSYNIYSRFEKNLLSYTNKNIGDIKFYSYAGGKEISRLENGSTQMSNLPYPTLSDTLLGSIILPSINENDCIYLLIDSYNELNNITCPLLKKELINKDLDIMLNNIKTSIDKKNVQFVIIFDIKIYEEIIIYEPYIEKIISNYCNIIVHKNNSLCSYTCDLVFGKILRGKNHKFNGIIDLNNFTIIEAFTNNNYHQLTNRTSGLSILGNGAAIIYILVKSNNNLVENIKITEITNNIELINIELYKDSVLKVHKNTNILLKLIKLIEYKYIINNLIIINNKSEIKQFIKDNLEDHFNWEFNFLESYNSNDLEKDIKVYIDNNISILYNYFIQTLNKIRLEFSSKRTFDDIINTHGHSLQLPSTQSNFLDLGFQIPLVKPKLQRQRNQLITTQDRCLSALL